MNAPRRTPLDISAQDFKLLKELDNKKKSEGATRTYLMLRDLLHLQDFKQRIQKIRKTLRIPPKGYESNVVFMNGAAYDLDNEGREIKRSKNLIGKVEDSLQIYLLSKPYFNKQKEDTYYIEDLVRVGREYLLFNKVDEKVISVGKIQLDRDSDSNLRTVISIRSDVRIGELQKYIQENWYLVSEYSRLINPTKSTTESRLRKEENIEMNVQIYNEYVHLLSKSKSDRVRGEFIHDILTRKFNKTSDAIKKIIERMNTKVAEVNT